MLGLLPARAAHGPSNLFLTGPGLLPADLEAPLPNNRPRGLARHVHWLEARIKFSAFSLQGPEGPEMAGIQAVQNIQFSERSQLWWEVHWNGRELSDFKTAPGGGGANL